MFENNRKEKWFFLTLLFIIAVVAMLIFWGLHAQAENTKKPFINIQEVTTPKGFTVWLVEDHTLPITAVKFMFKDSGTLLDTHDKQGLVRMLSNTMDEGAGGFDSQSFQKALSDHSITLSFDATRDDFGGNLVALSRHKNKAFELMSLALTSPRFDEEPVGRMRDANIARIQSSMSEPEWVAARILNDRAFDGHPYAQNSGGTISSLKSITRDDLKTLKDKALSRDSLLIAAAGDVTAQEISVAIDKIFGHLPENRAKNSFSSISIQNQSKIFWYEKDIPQTYIEGLVPAFDDKDPDYYALQILNYIYGGAGFGSRLMENAREERGLTYGVYSGLMDLNHTDALSISTSTKNESVSDMLSIIKDEMMKLQTVLVGDKELDDAKSYIIGSMPLALKSTGDLADIALSLQSKEKPLDYLDDYAEKINSVTKQDIQRVAKRVLKPENLMIVLVGKPENINNLEKIESLPNVE